MRSKEQMMEEYKRIESIKFEGVNPLGATCIICLKHMWRWVMEKEGQSPASALIQKLNGVKDIPTSQVS